MAGSGLQLRRVCFDEQAPSLQVLTDDCCSNNTEAPLMAKAQLEPQKRPRRAMSCQNIPMNDMGDSPDSVPADALARWSSDPVLGGAASGCISPECASAPATPANQAMKMRERLRRKSDSSFEIGMAQTRSDGKKSTFVPNWKQHLGVERYKVDMLGYQPIPTVPDSDDEHEVSLQTSGDSALVALDAGSGFLSSSCCEPGCLRSRVQAIVDSTWFQTVTFLAIVLNAIIIGFETDFPHLPYWVFFENSFLVIFTVELVLRLFLAGPRKFFCGNAPNAEPDAKRKSLVMEPRKSEAELGETARRKPPGEEVIITLLWNMFDFVIVVVGLITFVMNVLGTKISSNVTLFRAIRLLRILRILRVIRVIRFLKQLYLIAYGFIEGTMAVFWVAILAAACIYISSIMLVRTYGRPTELDANAEFFDAHFGSVPRCMFTLFEILASPSLGNYRDVIFDHPPLICFIVVFVIFGSFGISGLLTGVITESIIDKNQARVEELRLERERKRHNLERQSGELFDELVNEFREQLGKDGMSLSAKEHNLTVQELTQNKDAIMGLFQNNGVQIPNYDFDAMLNNMDFSDTGNIARSEFVYAIVELCEDVRPMSIMELNSQVSRCNVKVEHCRAKLEDLESSLLDMADAFEPPRRNISSPLCFPRTPTPAAPGTPAQGAMPWPATPSVDVQPRSSPEVDPMSIQQQRSSSRLERCEHILLDLQTSMEGLLHSDEKRRPAADSPSQPTLAESVAQISAKAFDKMESQLLARFEKLESLLVEDRIRAPDPTLSHLQEQNGVGVLSHLQEQHGVGVEGGHAQSQMVGQAVPDLPPEVVHVPDLPPEAVESLAPVEPSESTVTVSREKAAHCP